MKQLAVMRSNVSDRLAKALTPSIEESKSDNDNVPLNADDVQRAAAGIEAELFRLSGNKGDATYTTKARSLMFNLKTPSNAHLRKSVVRGQLPPQTLCSMSAKVS